MPRNRAEVGKMPSLLQMARDAAEAAKASYANKRKQTGAKKRLATDPVEGTANITC